MACHQTSPLNVAVALEKKYLSTYYPISPMESNWSRMAPILGLLGEAGIALFLHLGKTPPTSTGYPQNGDLDRISGNPPKGCTEGSIRSIYKPNHEKPMVSFLFLGVIA